jgi:hypothetical protein
VEHGAPAPLADPFDDFGPVAPVSRLRAHCESRGIAVSWDNYVRASDAAALLNLKPKTLRNMRAEGIGPRPRKGPSRSAHCEYPLAELIRFRPHTLLEII